MIYTKKQRALMALWQTNRLKRLNLLEGSVSSGKTWISLVLWAFWVKTMPRDKLYMMCAKSLTTLKRNCLLLLQELIGEQHFSFSLAAKEGYLFGRHILFEGANDARAEAKIRGLTLQGAYCDELTQFPQDFFTMLLSRLRLPRAKLIATTNPDAPGHWLKTDYIDRADMLDFLDVKFKIDDNTTLPRDYVTAIKKEYSGVFYERFILGKWVLAEGIIYPMYQQALDDPPENSRPKDYRLSVDYGTMNAFAALLWEKHGNIWYATRCYYYSGRETGVTKTDEEYGEALDGLISDIMRQREKNVKLGKSEYISKMRTIVDPSAASFITLLRKKTWYNVIAADNDVIDGIRDTATAMSLGLIKISPDIKEWRTEVEGYVWDSNAADDRPIKEDDHLMDSTRYFVFTEKLVVREKSRQRNRERGTNYDFT